jgi:hypothetical protein
VAPAPNGAGTHPDHEPTASSGAQRRPPLEEEVVAGIGTGTTGGIPVSALGQPATGGSAEVAGWAEPDDCRADASDPAGRGEMSGSAAVENPPWSRATDRTGVRADYRESRSVSVWQIASYLGLVPLEDSSGNRRRLGHITKQGNSLLRFLLVEAAQVTVRSLPEWRSHYVHLTMRQGRKIAKVAMARKLAVRLSWMMRKEWDYEQLKKFGSHAGQPGHRDGVK